MSIMTDRIRHRILLNFCFKVVSPFLECEKENASSELRRSPLSYFVVGSVKAPELQAVAVLRFLGIEVDFANEFCLMVY